MIDFRLIAPNICFSHRNIFQNGSMLRQNGQIFLSKRSKFCIVRTIRFCLNFTSIWFKYLLNNVWSFSKNNGKIKYAIEKSSFSVDMKLRLFCVTITIKLMLTLEVYSLSMHLICIWKTYVLVKFKQNCMVQNTRKFELFDKKKTSF